MSAPSDALPRICHSVITDLTITFASATDPPPTRPSGPPIWHCIEKDLHLHSLELSAWLQVSRVEQQELTAGDLVVIDIRVGHQAPNTDSSGSWESRPGGIWVLRSSYAGDIDRTVTDVDVLFGSDAVDPRTQWNLLQQPLFLRTKPGLPSARLTMRRGIARPKPPSPLLRAREDGKFKIAQISDTHMVTGPGVCKDSMDASGQPLPEIDADPHTVRFMGEVLDIEKPDLVLLTGDQLHHDIPDSQSALFKVVAPLIERSIPFAAVFGNHDDEGKYALSRAIQMSLLQDLPYSLCQAGPADIHGVGNYHLQILGPGLSEVSSATLFLLDSHGSVSRSIPFPGYDWIRQSQIDPAQELGLGRGCAMEEAVGLEDIACTAPRGTTDERGSGS